MRRTIDSGALSVMAAVLAIAAAAVGCNVAPSDSNNADELRHRFDAGSGCNVTADLGPTDAASAAPPPDLATPPSPAPSASGQWVMGYYTGYNMGQLPIAQIDWTGISHIIFCAVEVTPSYALDFSFFGAGADNAKAVAAAAHAHGRKALLMLGGAGQGNIGAAIKNDLPHLVSQLTAALATLGYDGIDLDIEDGTTVAGIIPLAQALRAAEPSMILTFPGSSVEVGTTVDPNVPVLVQSLDRYNIQSYFGGTNGLFTGTDWTGTAYFKSWFGSALSGATDLTPYAIDYSLTALANAGVPKSKLGMGIAFYAACYLQPSTTLNGQAITAPRQPANGPSSYCWDCGVGGGDNAYPLSAFFSSSSTFAASAPAEQKRDSVAQEPYLSLASPKSDSHCGGTTQYVLYEDETSIIAKGTFSKANGYGGTIIWTINQGLLPASAAGGRAPNALTQALKQGFLTP